MWRLGASIGVAIIAIGIMPFMAYADCYFPFEHHGTYAVQRDSNQYSEVMIEINRILPYGVCHRRIGNNLILKNGGNGCLRCFHMSIRSANVLQLHTRDPQHSCATKLNDTFSLCPTALEMSSPQQMRNTKIHELMMYKVRTSSNEQHVQQVYCPINGRFRFSYNIDDGTEAVDECPGEMSHLSNCPFGFGLNLHFRGCSALRSISQKRDMTFQCLGDWKDLSGNKYMALLDVDTYEDRPRYRCAMYHEDSVTGRVFVALSSDSSCHRHLQNATHGYERLVLHPSPSAPWPVSVRRASCRFPDWAQGVWQHSQVQRDTIVYKDTKHFKTYTAKCVSEHDGKYVIYSRSQCGDESYYCIWLKPRDINVMEFQLALSPSLKHDICDGHNFMDSGWVTQGRDSVSEQASCPVSGEYEGVIPNTGGQLCAKLNSDCNNPEIMFYTVISCLNASDIYEEREYRCLGTWTEGSVMYTYTQRRDALTFECFAGTNLADGSVYIAEAGTDQNCQRGVEPTKTGMLINKLAPCYNNLNELIPTTSSLTPKVGPRRPPLSPYPGLYPTGQPQYPGLYPTGQPHLRLPSATRQPSPRTTTKPWRPITARPVRPPSSGDHHQVSLAALLPILLRWFLLT